MSIEQMCNNALKTLALHINRSAGQHLRAMRCPAPTEQQRIVSNALYDMAMRLTDTGAANVDALVEAFCELSGVKYPPQKTEKK
jgi:hypothetical protein